MAAISIDLRTRILKACDRREETQEQIARRFCVSHGLVKKLLSRAAAPAASNPATASAGASR